MHPPRTRDAHRTRARGYHPASTPPHPNSLSNLVLEPEQFVLLRNSVIVFGGEHQIVPRELPQHIVALPGQPRHLLPRHDEHVRRRPHALERHAVVLNEGALAHVRKRGEERLHVDEAVCCASQLLALCMRLGLASAQKLGEDERAAEDLGHCEPSAQSFELLPHGYTALPAMLVAEIEAILRVALVGVRAPEQMLAESEEFDGVHVAIVPPISPVVVQSNQVATLALA